MILYKVYIFIWIGNPRWPSQQDVD